MKDKLITIFSGEMFLSNQVSDRNQMMEWGYMESMMLLMMGLVPIITLFLVIWIYNDAKKYSENEVLWALIVFCTMGLGILFYVLKRKKAPTAQTRNNKQTFSQQSEKITNSFHCRNCGDLLSLDDIFCPSCGVKVIAL